jgi:hypothetical protein
MERERYHLRVLTESIDNVWLWNFSKMYDNGRLLVNDNFKL